MPNTTNVNKYSLSTEFDNKGNRILTFARNENGNYNKNHLQSFAKKSEEAAAFSGNSQTVVFLKPSTGDFDSPIEGAEVKKCQGPGLACQTCPLCTYEVSSVIIPDNTEYSVLPSEGDLHSFDEDPIIIADQNQGF